ncbi:MAG: serine/threonine dehydratase [Proteobacteria bacterium]|nr:serine/threonine dehydratase [Pseudomonadota bacterium]
MPQSGLDLEDIRRARADLADAIITTPVLELAGPGVEDAFGPATRPVLKLELFQRTGSFKPRGALLNVLALSPGERARGICAVSGGNHAIATAYAARRLGTHARIVMLATANPFRAAQCRAWGADVEFAPTIHDAFARADELSQVEGRTLIHPFEGLRTALGSATLGLEFMEQVPDLDAVVVPVGGGGLAAGVSVAVKRVNPDCRVYGVEPEGADTMHRSLAAGRPVGIDRVTTIADSLGAPYAMPVSFELCRAHLDELVLVTDAALVASMRFLLEHGKLAVEPAGAASTAALRGPLKERLAGLKVGLIVCGSNIDAASFARLIA